MATDTTERGIEIKNLGPVDHAFLPAPIEGGLIVCSGRNGSGKSTILNAVAQLTTGKGERLSLRDCTERGSIRGLGAELTITAARSLRRPGELEVVALESPLSIADLVDPGIDKPDAADARRIKALVQLSGQAADPTLFHAVAGGAEQFERLVSPAALDTDDVVAMAARIKRDLETAARTAEREAERAEGAAKAHRAGQMVDVYADLLDPADLQARLEQAIRDEADTMAKAAAADQAIARAEEAKGVLAEAEKAYQGLTSAQASVLVDRSGRALDKVRLEIKAMEAALESKRKSFVEVEHDHAAAIQRRSAAVHHENNTARWRQFIDDAAAVQPIPPEAVTAATEAVQHARQAVEQGALARAAAERIKQAIEAERVALGHTAEAKRIREAAQRTDGVLSDLVAGSGSPLKVRDGRLVLETKARGLTYFADLSEGERWRIALDIGIEAVGPRGLLTIPQTAFEGLDPHNRRAIHEHLRGTGVIGYTAEASEGELSAEVYQ